MKKIILFIAAVAFCMSLKADTIYFKVPPDSIAVQTNVIIYNTVTNLAGTNSSTVVTNTINLNTQNVIYQTFQCFGTFRGTNTISLTINRTLDNSNWVTWWSTNWVANQAPSSLTTSNFELTSVGTWLAHQFIVTQAGTNVATNSVILNEMGH